MLRNLPPVTQGVALVYQNEEYRIYLPTGPDVTPVNGAVLDQELDRVGLELDPDWEDGFNLVEYQGQFMFEVTVQRKAGALADWTPRETVVSAASVEVA